MFECHIVISNRDENIKKEKVESEKITQFLLNQTKQEKEKNKCFNFCMIKSIYFQEFARISSFYHQFKLFFKYFH